MRIIQNIPDGIYQRVLANVQKPDPDILRVTELINPPLIKKLTLEHWDELRPLASDFLWSILGSAIHAELAQASDGVLIEQRITKEFFGITLSGQVDRYETGTKTIADYKSTSVWSILLGLKPEWEAQLNIYSFLLEEEGYPVSNLKIHAILRDWQVGKSVQKDYPIIPFMTLDVPKWGAFKTAEYIKKRVEIHKAEPLPCTAEERWERAPTFAVMKTGRKSAVRVKDTREEAEIYLNTKVKSTDKPKCEIVERKGEAIRCKNYCLVRDVCKYNPYNEEK